MGGDNMLRCAVYFYDRILYYATFVCWKQTDSLEIRLKLSYPDMLEAVPEEHRGQIKASPEVKNPKRM